MATSEDLKPVYNGGEAGAMAAAAGMAGQEEVLAKTTLEYIYISKNKLKYINSDYKKISEKMYDYKADVKLKVGQSNFKAHRNVLSDASDYFAAMFTHQMKEKEESEIELKDISPAGFTAMMDYFYHGHVTVEEKIVPDILEAGRFFHVEWILDICCDYLVRHLSNLNFPLTMELADTYSLGDLRWDIFRHFGAQLPTMIQQEDFYRDLSGDLLLQYLMECMYVDVSEFFLLQLILNWVHVDEGSRKEQLLPLLHQLRFPTMEFEDLEDIPAEVLQYPDIVDEIEEAKTYALNLPAQCLKTEDKYLHRGSRPTVLVTCFDYTSETNVLVYKDPENEEANLFVEQLGPSGLTNDYSTMQQASIGNFLFAAGGYNEDFTSAACMYRLDPNAREWTEMATMSQPRVSFALCSSKDRLFAVGGVHHIVGDLGGETILSSVEMYNPEENCWVNLPKLPYGSFDQAAAHSHGKLYVSGGISESESHPLPLPTVFALADGADEWSSPPNLLTARQGHSMTAHGGKLYVLGGYTTKPNAAGFRDCETNEAFDIETQQWTAILSTPENYGHLYRHCGHLENRIYFLCNKESDVYLSYYDTEKDEFDNGVVVGEGVHKVGVLKLAYPQT